jgi:hypothetical protein
METPAEKTHYRRVFKSDHLGLADLEDMIEAGSNLIFTIKHVKQEYGATVSGKKGDFNIAYFAEDIKPLVLNATNSKMMKSLTGSAFVEDWSSVPVRLYIDPSAKLKGEVVGGVRISPDRVTREKPELLVGTTAWTNAVAAYKRDGNFLAVEKRMKVSEESKTAIKTEAENVA